MDDQEGCKERVFDLNNFDPAGMLGPAGAFIHAGHFAIRSQGGRCRMADVNSPDRGASVIRKYQGQGRRNNGAEGNCKK